MLRLKNLNPYEQHKLIINEYVLNQPGSTKFLQRDSSRDRRDIDIIRENHKFLWDDETSPDTWEKRLAKKYYDKLFKEYCICDLSRYKENKVALRWRIEKEVVLGKGQFICGNKICDEQEELRSWEVNFAYQERGEKKNALVKLRLCPDCSLMLNYHSKKREVKRVKKRIKEEKKLKNKRKKRNNDDDDDGNDRRSHSDESSSEEENESKKSKEQSVQNQNEKQDNEAVNKEELASFEDEMKRQVELQEKVEKDASNIWSKKQPEVEEVSREEEFEKYLEDLLL